MPSADINNDLLISIGSALSEAIGTGFEVLDISPIAGGSNHYAARLETTAGTFFVKWNSKEHLPSFEAERRGLETLHKTNTLRVPTVFKVVERAENAFLVMEFIVSGTVTLKFWEDFGHSLASLHRNSSPMFGFPENNFIGSLPQSNTVKAKFVDFFVEERLRPMLRLAYNAHVLDTTELSRLERVIPLLDKAFPPESPALLHGDLLSANLLADEHGNPTVIDPAVYYGHREAEIAFMTLFSDFHQYVFQAYNETYPMERGWRGRLSAYNLYPLLVHLCLFGRQYWTNIDEALKKFKV
jgi:protein-ribulosamine 3-kinase